MHDMVNKTTISVTNDKNFKNYIEHFNKQYNELTCKQLCGEPNGTLMFSVVNNFATTDNDNIKDSTNALFKKKYLKYKIKYLYLKKILNHKTNAIK